MGAGGTLGPGNSPGALTIDGDLALADEAILSLELGGTDPGQFDQLFVSGEVDLLGLIQISFIDDFLPDKDWDCLAVSAAILDDPYSDMAGVNPQHDSTGPTVEARKYKVCVRVVDRHGVERKITLTLGLGLPEDESRRAFSPLLDRLYDGERGEFGGERYETRAVKSSDVELILNELRTWDCNSVIDKENGEVEVNLDNVDDVVISSEKRKFILRILRRYQGDYPALAGHLRLKGQLAFGA